jgi:hypothetical protein
LFLLVGCSAPCGARTGLKVPDTGPDAASTDARTDVPDARCPEGSPVDVLLVVDNSSSMAEEQRALAEQIPALIEALVVPPDLDGDGEADWNPVRNLHVGVITTDLGGAGSEVGTCEDPDGDDAVLRTTGAERARCRRRYPPFLEFDANEDRTRRLVRDVGCLAQVGTAGCGFEHTLEAPLKAVTPSTSELRFRGEPGHGDGINAGFLRPGSLFAVLVLTDEDDCSVEDLGLMQADDPRFIENLNLRCFAHPGALHPVQRFIDGFMSLPDVDPERFALTLIAGVPPDLVPDPLAVPYERILADPRMLKRVDPTDPTMLAPSCETAGRGSATPPRRLLEFARSFPGRTAVRSVCSEDFRPALLGFARLIADPPCP